MAMRPNDAARLCEEATMARLNGRVAIVTGAGTGIGREIANQLAGEGASVVLVGRRLALLQEAADAITAAGGRAFARAADITQAEAVETLIDWVSAELGTVDILINNAGSAAWPRNLAFITPHDWQATVHTQLTALH